MKRCLIFWLFLILIIPAFGQKLKLEEMMILYDKGMDRLDAYVASNHFGSEKTEEQSIIYYYEKNSNDSLYRLEVYHDGRGKIKQIILYSNKPQHKWDLRYYVNELNQNGFKLSRHNKMDGSNGTSYFYNKGNWWVMLEKYPEEEVTLRDRKPSKTLSTVIVFLFKQ